MASLYGVYTDRAALEDALDELKEEGCANTDVSVLFSDKESSQKFAVEHKTKAPEGALAGGAAGVALGGALGWLAGIGAFSLPGIGPFIAAGPIASAIAGASFAGTVGGVAGALMGVGLPEYEAKQYESALKQGRMLLAVQCESSTLLPKAKEVLRRTGALDVITTGEMKAA
jgi:hypothetical protein